MNDSHKQEMMEPMPVQYSRFNAVELMCAPIRYDQWPRRNWKKSQKKIRRERRQRGGKR
jgi:hypothetical protein